MFCSFSLSFISYGISLIKSKILHYTDSSYGYVVDKQPIGCLLFRLFCEQQKPFYHKYNCFLDEVVSMTSFSFHSIIILLSTIYRSALPSTNYFIKKGFSTCCLAVKLGMLFHEQKFVLINSRSIS